MPERYNIESLEDIKRVSGEGVWKVSKSLDKNSLRRKIFFDNFFLFSNEFCLPNFLGTKIS